MDKFTASNGATVEAIIAGGRRITYSNGISYPLPLYALTALREFFLSERDKELGRWRWPDNPDYVVYAKEGWGCSVLNESNAHTMHYKHHSRPVGGSNVAQAARAYFEAHPERKPWEDAEQGEVWVLATEPGNFFAARVIEDHRGILFARVDDEVLVFKHWIVDGYRIWPEEKDA